MSGRARKRVPKRRVFEDRAGAAVFVDRYRPNEPGRVAAWPRIADAVRAVVHESGPVNPRQAKDRMWAVSGLFAWADACGYDVDTGRLLSPEFVEPYVASLPDGSAGATVRSRLSQTARARSSRSGWPDPGSSTRAGDAVAPYTEVELARLIGLADQLTGTRPGRHLDVVLGFCAGACLRTGEACRVTAGDIETTAAGLLIVHAPEPRARRVPVLTDLAPLLRRAVDAHDGPGPLMNTRDASHAVEKVPVPPGVPKPSAERMRATWIVRHLNNGVPLPVLMETAGLRSLRRIEKLVVHCAPTARATADRWLSEGRP